jgi:hypothetical protein
VPARAREAGRRPARAREAGEEAGAGPVEMKRSDAPCRVWMVATGNGILDAGMGFRV